MLFLKKLFKAPRFLSEARAIYRQVAERARQPVFYTEYGVPDTIDGRFEMVSLHAYALFHGLKGKGGDADALGQAIYDAMFDDLDGSLREMGVADLGVGRRIKTMTEALNGRINAYDQAFAGADDLAAAVRRNVYGTVAVTDQQVAGMTAYLGALRPALADLTVAGLCDGSALAGLPTPTGLTSTGSV